VVKYCKTKTIGIPEYIVPKIKRGLLLRIQKMSIEYQNNKLRKYQSINLTGQQ